MNKLFETGQLVATANAAQILNPTSVMDAVRRFTAGDWGNVPVEDKQANDNALEHGARLLGSYKDGDTAFWIITEADRSVTTILLPEDY